MPSVQGGLLKLDEPKVIFGPWTKWSQRERLSDCDDVPRDFDLGGVYIFGKFNGSAPSVASHITEDVIYIGMSIRLTGRCEAHEVARRYQKELGDSACDSLYVAQCDFGPRWTSFHLRRDADRKVKLALMRHIERKLIWEFASTFERLPALNRD